MKDNHMTIFIIEDWGNFKITNSLLNVKLINLFFNKTFWYAYNYILITAEISHKKNLFQDLNEICDVNFEHQCIINT